MPLMKAPINGEYVGVDSVAVNDGTGQRFDYNRLKQIENTLSDQAYQEQTLTHGLNIISTNQPSNMKVEFYGNTLVNLLGKDGNCESLNPFQTGGSFLPIVSSSRYKDGENSLKFTANDGAGIAYKDYNFKLDSSKYFLVTAWAFVESYASGRASVSLRDIGTTTIRYTSDVDDTVIGSWQLVYLKIPSSNALVGDGFRLFFGVNSTGTMTVYFDSISIYEIDQETYDKIGVSLTDADVERMFPYVDSVQHVKNPVVKVEGENLFPTFNEVTIPTDAKVNNPYELELNAKSTWNFINADFTLIKNQPYSFSVFVENTSEFRISIFDGEVRKDLYWGSVGGLKTAQFTPTNEKVRIQFANPVIGNYKFKEPMLNLGSTPKPFVPRNPSYLYAETVLAGDSNKKDILSYNEDKRRWEKIKNWEIITLDGSLDWVYSGDYEGFSRVKLGLTNAKDQYPIVSKYDGTIIQPATAWDKPDVSAISSNTIYITISDADATGYDLTTSAGIKQYFADKNYFLTYQLAEPEIEPVTVEGDVSIQGDAQVEVSEGVIVREKVTPKLHYGYYQINYIGDTTTSLKYKTDNIIAVYENGKEFNKYTKDTGGSRVLILPSDFDNTAIYTVTYTVRDKHATTANINEVKATFNKSLKSSFQGMTAKVSDLATTISVQAKQIYDLMVKTRNL